jgi:hypothetical protein
MPRFTPGQGRRSESKQKTLCKARVRPLPAQPLLCCFFRLPSCSRKPLSVGGPKTRRAQGVKFTVHYIAFLVLFLSGGPGSFGNGFHSMHRARKKISHIFRTPGRISAGCARCVFDLRANRKAKPGGELWEPLQMHWSCIRDAQAPYLCERWSEVQGP